MPVISTADFRNGITISHEGNLFDIIEFQFVKPGKGGAFVRTRLKNVRTGQVIDYTFDSGDKVQQAIIDKEEWEYLYRDGEFFVFMESKTFEQHQIEKRIVESLLQFLKENTTCMFKLVDGEILSCHLPDFMVFEVKEADGFVRGQTAAGSNKPAVIETGAVIQVPVFISQGERIKVDTRTGRYVERVSG